MVKVLVIDDEEVLARTICNYLRKRDIEADFALDARSGLEKFAQLRPDVVFLDVRLGNDDGMTVLGQLHERQRDVHVVMMTGHGDVGLAVQAMKRGARDFMTKPVPLATIALMVANAKGTELVDAGTKRHAASSPATSRILGRSSAINETKKSIDRILVAVQSVSHEPPPVLITGESGTGKELVARALHEGGPRAKGPFVAVNCASLPAELVESEFFGHERGAFTDAKLAKAGLFEAAKGGILFLDEVGDMPANAQAKLLRVLESRTVRRVGSTRESPVDVWVVAATNRNLAERVEDGHFRSDLMFRLQVLWVDLPPLRERDSDVLALAERFILDMSSRYGVERPTLSPGARSALVEHSWPGNIRELRNVLERAVLVAADREIQASDLFACDRPPTASQTAGGRQTLQEIEISTLQSALQNTRGNVSRAAEVLGISRDTMRYRMQKFGLSVFL
jgi:two-component system, NtrC family, response regulator AtoC